MKTMFKSLSMLAVAACAGMGITSCTSDANLFNPEVIEENVKADYAANFIKKYGSQINIADQTWDLAEDYTSSLFPMMSTRGVFGQNGFNPEIVEMDGMYDVLPETIEWLDTNLPEKQNNKEKASPFVLENRDNTFTIVPIYIGEAAYFWKLHLQIFDETGDIIDRVVWEKGDGVDIWENNAWKTLGKGRYETTIGKTVQSKQFEVKGCPEGTQMSLYLEVFNANGKKLPSSYEAENAIAAIPCPTPSNLEPVGNVQRGCMIIGCEDQYDNDSDWDMNDVVFMIYGNPLPPVVPTVKKYYQFANKRYLVEDLGSTDDFDFNDVVVDVKAQREVTLTYVQDQLVDVTRGEWTNQHATVRALGGTIEVSMKIGNTEWKKEGNYEVSEMVNTKNPDYSKVLAEFDVTGWDPKTNNIEVEARNLKSDKVNHIKFPKKGEAPMIVAVKPRVDWMKERQEIPADWFYTE